ncbi:unnamed protein product [Dracunculus medinensis]|uniref:Nucleotide-diphospho-sugar transferase domain-containing protein n=1 Tax=Dracunculus medinensis TaxID=318479 RepID=A0A0N4U9B1_DRAME|nr:unnamed protein product [Dracunculus medinensis]
MNCKHARYLDALGLLDDDIDDEFRFFNLEKDRISKPVIVTAFSQTHWSRGRRLIASIRRHLPDHLIIVYDLGLDFINARFLSFLCNVKYRKFYFKHYPERVAKVREFRWKPIIIAEILQEYDTLWYFDSTVMLKKTNLSNIYNLLECHKNAASDPKVLTPREIQKNCRNSSYLFHIYAGHGIFSATHPDLYQYFPTNLFKIKTPKARMYDAGLVFVVRTARTVQQFLRWYVACALESKCMAPRRSVLRCKFDKNDFFGIYARCHRYDQSVINLLVANAFQYDYRFYTSGFNDEFFEVNRLDSAPVPDSELVSCDKQTGK